MGPLVGCIDCFTRRPILSQFSAHISRFFAKTRNQPPHLLRLNRAQSVPMVRLRLATGRASALQAADGPTLLKRIAARRRVDLAVARHLGAFLNLCAASMGCRHFSHSTRPPLAHIANNGLSVRARNQTVTLVPGHTKGQTAKVCSARIAGQTTYNALETVC